MRRIGAIDPFAPEPVGITPFLEDGWSPGGVGAAALDPWADVGGAFDRPDPFAKLQGLGSTWARGNPFDRLTRGFLGESGSAFDDLARKFASRGGALDQAGQTVTGGGAAGLSNAGGQWAKLDAHNPEIAAAVAKYPNVPANLLKSMINRESSGNWEASQWMAPVDGTHLHPFVGVKREAAESVGFDFDAMFGNKQMQIDAMAAILSRDIAAYGTPEAAASNYLTGKPDGYLTGARDSAGMSASYYVNEAISAWKQLDALGGGGSWTGGGSGWSGAGGLGGIFGNDVGVPEWGEFNQPSGNGLYGYGTQYGLDGVSHTGIDVPGNIGAQFTAGVSGTVTCAGTGNGPGANGGGCAAFNDVMGNGAGRIEVQLDNGAVLIFGHSSDSFVQPGQRVDASTVLGTVGGMNSAHLHIEARVPDPSMPSGYRIVDPRTVLGGGGGAMNRAGTTVGGYGGTTRNRRMFDLLFSGG